MIYLPTCLPGIITWIAAVFTLDIKNSLPAVKNRLTIQKYEVFSSGLPAMIGIRFLMQAMRGKGNLVDQGE